MAPPPCPPPYLMLELIGEILLRFPPGDPACLVRASLVCKPWRRLICDPVFRRRYVAFHRAPPPLLGFLHDLHTGVHRDPRPRFVSTTKPSLLPLQPFLDGGCGWYWRVLDCRHGRVLFQARNWLALKLVVLDPTSGKKNWLPEPPIQRWMANTVTAAVLCAVRGCGHLDCHSGPFLIVLVSFNVETGPGVLQSHLYSSDANTWSSSASLGPGFRTVCKPSVLIGDDIYFVLAFPSLAVLKFSLEKNHFSIIDRPEAPHDEFECKKVLLMAMEDGSLGFAVILGSTLCQWSRNVKNSEVGGGWAPCGVIELQTMIPFKQRLRVVGSAEGSGILFVASDVGIYSLDLKSCCERKVDYHEPREDISIFPFMSFYIPDSSSSKLRLPLGPH